MNNLGNNSVAGLKNHGKSRNKPRSSYTVVTCLRKFRSLCQTKSIVKIQAGKNRSIETWKTFKSTLLAITSGGLPCVLVMRWSPASCAASWAALTLSLSPTSEYERDLKEVIKDETSGDFTTALLAMLEANKDESDEVNLDQARSDAEVWTLQFMMCNDKAKV